MPTSDAAPPVLRFGPFCLDQANARLTRGGAALEVVPKDLDVLCHLAQRPGRLVTKDELLDAVWERRFVSESVLKNVVSRLRAVLGDDARNPRYIETAQRRGYRFIAAIEDGAVTTPNIAPTEAKLLATPWPTATVTDPPAPLVARAEALHWLHQRLASAIAGGTRLALVVGEAGIGKSSLLRAFTQRIEQPGQAWVAQGQCIESSGSGEPYLPVLEALSSLCKAQPEAGLIALMRQVAPTWLVQLPWFMTPEDRLQLMHEVAGATRERMLREFGELLSRITAERPLTVVLEDLHWSDPATLQLLGYLVRRRANARALLLGSLRPAEVIAADHPLKVLRQELRGQRLCDELELALFSEQDAADLLALRAGGGMWPEALVRALHDHTGGLPLFLSAVADELDSEALSVQGMNAQQREERQLQHLRQVPRSIFGLIEQQHARLPEQSQRWLEAASVAGVEFAHAPLADALGVEADALQSAFDALVRSGAWLRDSGVAQLPDGRVAARYEFRHAIYRNVLYELAGAARRVTMHRRLAAALASAHATQPEAIASELAVHYERGQEPAQAVRQLALAAHRALRRFSASEAATIARHGLGLLELVSDRAALRDTEIELHVEVGVSMAVLKGVTSPDSSGAFARAAQMLDDLHPAPARIAALHGIWWSMLARGKFERARNMAARALVLAERHHDEGLAFAGHSAMGITQAHLGNMTQAQAHLTRALERRQVQGVVLPEAMFTFEPGVQLMCYQSACMWTQGRPTEAGAFARQALARAESLEHPISLIIANFFNGLHLCMAEDFEQLKALTAGALRATTEQRLERGAGTLTWLNGRAMVALGEVDAGLEAMRQGHAVQLESHQGYALTRWHEYYGAACLQAGRMDEALTTLDAGLRLADTSGEHASTSAMHRMRGRVLQNLGRKDEALAAYELARTVAQEQGAPYLDLGALVAGLGLQPRQRKAAAREELVRALERWADPLSPPFVVQARNLLA